MQQGEYRKGRFARLALKVGTVASAAAALLAENAAGDGHDAHASRRHVVSQHASIARAVDRPDVSSPPLLVLKPSLSGAQLVLAGHRSHSSHSSHRSHVSGSSHSSHFSSSIRAGSTASRPTSRSEPSSSTSASYSGSPSSSGRSSSFFGSSSNQPAGAADAVPSPPARQVVAQPAKPVVTTPPVDYSDPKNRYQLISISMVAGVQKAFIKDLLKRDARLLSVGEMIGEAKLIEISKSRNAIRLKPTSGTEITLKQ